MSLSARNWAWAAQWIRDGKPEPMKEKLTLLCLAELENAEYGYAFPSHERIAELTGQSERTVRTHLKALEVGGAIRIEKRPSSRGRWMRNVYVLNVPEKYRETDEQWMGHQEGQWH